MLTIVFFYIGGLRVICGGHWYPLSDEFSHRLWVDPSSSMAFFSFERKIMILRIRPDRDLNLGSLLNTGFTPAIASDIAEQNKVSPSY